MNKTIEFTSLYCFFKKLTFMYSHICSLNLKLHRFTQLLLWRLFLNDQILEYGPITHQILHVTMCSVYKTPNFTRHSVHKVFILTGHSSIIIFTISLRAQFWLNKSTLEGRHNGVIIAKA